MLSPVETRSGLTDLLIGLAYQIVLVEDHAYQMHQNDPTEFTTRWGSSIAFQQAQEISQQTHGWGDMFISAEILL